VSTASRGRAAAASANDIKIRTAMAQRGRPAHGREWKIGRFTVAKKRTDEASAGETFGQVKEILSAGCDLPHRIGLARRAL